jgi:hypothetical protein
MTFVDNSKSLRGFTQKASQPDRATSRLLEYGEELKSTGRSSSYGIGSG